MVVALLVSFGLMLGSGTAEATSPYQPPPEPIDPAPGPYRITIPFVWGNGAVIPAGAVVFYVGGVFISLSDWAVSQFDTIKDWGANP